MTTGVWCWKPTKSDIELAIDLGFNRLDIMINEISKQRSPIDFNETLPWSREKLRDAAKMAIDLGMKEVHFTAWVMPHVTYMAYAGDSLSWLVDKSDAHGVVLDAEGPWTHAKSPDRDGSARMFREQASGIRFLGVTGIGYADAKKLDPLIQIADYGVPQCYSTRTSGVSPQHVGRLASHWENFGKPLCPALAAYRQTGIIGYAAGSAMRTARQRLRKYDTVIYWSLRHIKGNPIMQEILRMMLAGQRSPEGEVA
jgi:hypothetical protein